MHYVQQTHLFRTRCLNSSHSASGKWLKHNTFIYSVHVHELGKMSVILFYLLRIHTYCVAIFVSIRHRYINVDVPNIHTHVSVVHSVSGAVSLVFVSDRFANTKLCSEGRFIFFSLISGWLLLHRFCISIAYSLV